MPRREFLKVAGTTALAVSAAALTGCGGTPSGGNGGNGGHGNNGDNGGTDAPGGDTGDNGDNGGTGSDDSDNTQPGKISYKDTRTAKYFASKGITPTNFYMEGSVTDGSWSGKVLVAKSGKNTRYRRLLSGGSSRTGFNTLVLGDTAYELNDKKQQYQLHADDVPDSWGEKDIKRQTINFQYGLGNFIVPANNGDILTIQETTYVVNGVPYDAEWMKIESEKSSDGTYMEYSIFYCFEGDKLVYTVCGVYTVTINQLYPNPDPSLLKLPESYTRVPKGEWLESDWEF